MRVGYVVPRLIVASLLTRLPKTKTLLVLLSLFGVWKQKIKQTKQTFIPVNQIVALYISVSLRHIK